MQASIADIIERYEDDIRSLCESGDPDDRIVADVLADVIDDLNRMETR